MPDPLAVPLDSRPSVRHHFYMRSWLTCAVCLSVSACSWTFDGNAPDLPLVGQPPSLGSLQRLNNGPVYDSAIVAGVDGAFWLALQEENKKLRVVRLEPPTTETSVEGDQFIIAWRAFFAWQNGDPPADPMAPTPATLKIISAGESDDQAALLGFEQGVGQVLIGGADDVFAYVPQNADASSYQLVQRSGKRRSIPFPPAADGGMPTFPGGFFSGDGHIFFDRGPCATGCMTDPNDGDRGGTELKPLAAHYTQVVSDIDLGLQPRRMFLYDPSPDGRRFVTCGVNGVAIVPVVPSATNPALTLDPDPCASEVFTAVRVKNDDGTSEIDVYYSIAGELRRVPINGSRAPERALDEDVERVLVIYDPTLIVYSQDPGDRYIYGVGDGWIGDWRFMNRGRAPSLSFDKKKIRFLEDAAQPGGIGTLSMAPIGGSVQRLARNVYQYDEIDDNQVLAAANHAFRGTQNRIILIDEEKSEAHWVVDQAAQYNFIPNSTDILVDIVTGASSADLVRVPLPSLD